MHASVEELAALLALTRIAGLGPKTVRLLVAQFGGVWSVFEASPEAMVSVPGVTEAIAREIASANPQEDVQEEMAYYEAHDIRLLPYWDADYPVRLKEVPDAPLLLFYKGSAPLNRRRILAVVGTRTPTSYGMYMTEAILRDLSGYDILIVSGLAYGIDALAHRTALEQGMDTVAVLAHGMDTLYPALHKGLAQRIVRQGGLLTEYPKGHRPYKERFPARNRIIAALSDAVLIIESGRGGGSMITAQYAVDYHREVLAVPGRATDEKSEGTNYLIYNQTAQLVRDAEDIVECLQWQNARRDSGVQMEMFPQLDDEEKELLSHLPKGVEVPLEHLVAATQWTIPRLSTLLLGLEMKGLIKSCPGSAYMRLT